MLTECYKYLESEIYIWKITEETDELFSEIVNFLTEKDLEHYKKIKSVSRKKEWLAVRILLKSATNQQKKIKILYDKNGKPQIKNFNISISHSGCYACIIVSKTQKCGIDIQKITEKTKKLSGKFLSDYEISKYNINDIKITTLLWSLKETAFKLYGKGNLSFIEGIKIEEISENIAKIKIKEDLKITANYKFIDDYSLSYALI